MSNSLVGVAIDCADAVTLARFWADVLGRKVAEDSTPEHVVLLAEDTDAGWPLIVFNIVPEGKFLVQLPYRRTSEPCRQGVTPALPLLTTRQPDAGATGLTHEYSPHRWVTIRWGLSRHPAAHGD